MGRNITRLLSLPANRSTFLWGPRKSGKSTWLRHSLSEAWIIDLLQSDVFADYLSRPALLREQCLGKRLQPGSLVVLDEVQKLPALLDEVHWLIENCGLRFILTGSSARKMRRGQSNLLGGRAARRELKPLCMKEILPVELDGPSIEKIMRSGLLPSHYLSEDPEDELRSYVGDYLKEEIAAESVVQNLPAFSAFLRTAAICNGELLNYQNVARDVGVSAKVVSSYFTILEDTLLGYRLNPWRRAGSRRLIQTDKFYLFDVGVANWLCRRRPTTGTPEFGKSFEHLVLMELLAFRAYRSLDLEICFWRTASGLEVDFLVDDRRLAIEVKSSHRVHVSDLSGLSALSDEGPVGERIVVALVTQPLLLTDRAGTVRVLPFSQFVAELWSGALLT